MANTFVTLCSGFGYRQPKRPRSSRTPFGTPQPVAVRDMFQSRPAPSTGPGIPVFNIRPQQHQPTAVPASNLPDGFTVRGTIPTAPLTEDERQSIMANLERDTLGGSGARVRSSNWNTWKIFHDRWFGGSTDYLPLTQVTIAAVAGQMKSRGYRSFPGFLAAARDRHVEAGQQPHWQSWSQRYYY